MKPQTITIDDVEYVRKDSLSALADTHEGMRYCIIRCRDAGVHAGYVKHHEGREVTLLKSRRLWKWHGKTLSGLATEGTTNADKCKYANEVPEITVLDACEIIPCTGIGKSSITGMKEWVNE
jgi:hypothetical protein